MALDCHCTCLRFVVDGDDPPVRLGKRDDVWKHVRLRQVFIPQHGRGGLEAIDSGVALGRGLCCVVQ